MILTEDSKIDKGIYKDKKVSFILETDKKYILSLIKEGYMFDNNVLSKAGIKKTIREEKITSIVVDHEVDNKTYEKDTLSISKILNEISTVDNIKYNQTDAVDLKDKQDSNNLINEDEIYID